MSLLPTNTEYSRDVYAAARSSFPGAHETINGRIGKRMQGKMLCHPTIESLLYTRTYIFTCGILIKIFYEIFFG